MSGNASRAEVEHCGQKLRYNWGIGSLGVGEFYLLHINQYRTTLNW